MILFGTLVNGAGILVGSLIGLFFRKIPERTKETTMHGIGLAVLLIGLQMAIQTEQIIVVLLSLLFGAVIGEGLKLEEKFEQTGVRLEAKFSKGTQSKLSEGFITASLIFVIGAMAVVGALDSGIRGDHDVLVTKAIIDAFVALVLTTTLGGGVMLSVIPVLLYEGSITLLATQIQLWVPKSFMDVYIVEMTATGGILIMAIGLNMLNLIQIRVANLLPSLLFVGFILYAWILLDV